MTVKELLMIAVPITYDSIIRVYTITDDVEILFEGSCGEICCNYTITSLTVSHFSWETDVDLSIRVK